VQELASRVGLHPNTIRAHLELLVEYGHVTRLRDESRRPGRPRQMYAVAAPPEPSPPQESQQRNFQLLAAVLAGYLRHTEDPQAAAVEAGHLFGARLIEATTAGPAAATGSDEPSLATVSRVLKMLDDIGFQPELTEDRTAIRLHHCPFHELAQDQPDIVCSVHLGLLRGALQQLGAPPESTRLIPFVTPRLCVVELGQQPS
jgi:predicted ArsR family transcriptional regulator